MLSKVAPAIASIVKPDHPAEEKSFSISRDPFLAYHRKPESPIIKLIPTCAFGKGGGSQRGRDGSTVQNSYISSTVALKLRPSTNCPKKLRQSVAERFSAPMLGEETGNGGRVVYLQTVA